MRTALEIEDQIGEAQDKIAEGGSNWPGMTYEEGVAAALLWVTEDRDEKPMED